MILRQKKGKIKNKHQGKQFKMEDEVCCLPLVLADARCVGINDGPRIAVYELVQQLQIPKEQRI